MMTIEEMAGEADRLRGIERQRSKADDIDAFTEGVCIGQAEAYGRMAALLRANDPEGKAIGHSIEPEETRNEEMSASDLIRQARDVT